MIREDIIGKALSKAIVQGGFKLLLEALPH